MEEVDTVIKEKLVKVREYRRGLIGEEIKEEGGEKKRKHISFAWFSEIIFEWINNLNDK